MTLKCDCGGTLQAAIASSFDFSAFAGISVELRYAPCLQCDRCSAQTLHGKVIGHALELITRKLVQQAGALEPSHARFLRKELRLSPVELAKEFSVSEEDVDAWESGQTQITEQQSQRLRALIVGTQKIALGSPKTEAEHALPATRPKRSSYTRNRKGCIVISDEKWRPVAVPAA